MAQKRRREQSNNNNNNKKKTSSNNEVKRNSGGNKLKKQQPAKKQKFNNAPPKKYKKAKQEEEEPTKAFPYIPTNDSDEEEEDEQVQLDRIEEFENAKAAASASDDSDDEEQVSDSDEEEEEQDEFDVNELEQVNPDNEDDIDKEADEIQRLQDKHMKKIEKRLPGYHKKQKDSDEVPRLPAFDDERTRTQFSQNIARVLSATVPAVDKWSFPKAKLPVLVTAKGKSKQLITQTKEMQQLSKIRAEKQYENELILTRNHILPSLATVNFEKELKEVATRGVVKLLNQVVLHRRKEGQEEEAIDDYAILRKFTRTGKKK